MTVADLAPGPRRTATTAPTLHVHIGLPKTASTWLQERLFPLLSGIDVSASPRSRLVTSRIDEAAEDRLLHAAFRRSEHVWDAIGPDILAELFGRASPERDCLVSEEGIGRTASRPTLLAAHLAALDGVARRHGFGRVHVIAVVRRQDEWLASHYAQVSDRRPNPSEADFAAVAAETIDPHRERYGFGMLLDYSALLQTIEDIAPAVSVSVLAYEALAREPDAFSRRLAEVLGLPGVPDTGPALNVRSSAGVWRLRRKGLNRLRAPATFALAPDVSRRILSTYAASNRSLAERTGLPLARYGYLAD